MIAGSGGPLGVSPPVVLERLGSVARIVLARPDVRNALDIATTRLLASVLEEFAADDSLRVAVLGGAGGSFCAGADLKEMATGVLYEPWAGETGMLSRPPCKPVLAAVEGHACAGGLGLALWCDLRVIDCDTVFGVFSRRWGVPMSDGTTVRLPRLIGQGRANDLLLTGRSVGADEAMAIGLADRMAPRGEAWRVATELALEIAAFPQGAMLCDRRSAYAQAGMAEAAALRLEAGSAARVRDADAARGAERFAVGEGRGGVHPEGDS